MVFQRCVALVGVHIAFQHATGPGQRVGHAGRQALHQLAHQGRRQPGVEQRLRQTGLARIALQPLHEGQHAEALVDQRPHRLQLVAQADQGLVTGAAARAVGQRGADVLCTAGAQQVMAAGAGQADLVTQHRRLAARRGGGVDAVAQRGMAFGRAWLGAAVTAWHHPQRRAGGGCGRPGHGRGLVCGGLCGSLGGRLCSQPLLQAGRLLGQLGLAALEHALAHIVLEGQRAHAQGLDIPGHRAVQCRPGHGVAAGGIEARGRFAIGEQAGLDALLRAGVAARLQALATRGDALGQAQGPQRGGCGRGLRGGLQHRLRLGPRRR